MTQQVILTDRYNIFKDILKENEKNVFAETHLQSDYSIFEELKLRESENLRNKIWVNQRPFNVNKDMTYVVYTYPAEIIFTSIDFRFPILNTITVSKYNESFTKLNFRTLKERHNTYKHNKRITPYDAFNYIMQILVLKSITIDVELFNYVKPLLKQFIQYKEIYIFNENKNKINLLAEDKDLPSSICSLSESGFSIVR